MRRAIASLGSGPHEPLLRLARRTFVPFARRHGYSLHLHTEPIDRTRPAPWSKIPIIRSLLEDNDEVLWLDSDLMIVDGREDVPSPSLMALVEHVTAEGSMPNSGVWKLRAGDDADRFLQEVWDQEDLIDHRWWENAAVCRLLGYDLDPMRLAHATEWRSRTDFLDKRWNSIAGDRAERARIRHYPGYKIRTRRILMTRDLVLRRR